MFCPNCGSQLNDGLKFCTQCGTPLADVAPADEAATAYEAPAYEAAPAYDAPAYEAAPAYDAPVYEAAPAYDAPAYDAPAYEAAPVYDAPAYDAAPVYDAPAYNQAPPMYNQYQTPPAYQPTYVGYSQNAAEPQKRNPGKVCGILSLIFSIICYPFMIAYGSGIPFWIAALILGIVGSSLSKRNGFKNGMAKAGILITLIPLIVFVAAVIVAACVMLVFAVLKTGY